MSKKRQYRIRNWKEYNRSLIQRGSITFWFDEKSRDNWFETQRSGKRGRPTKYSDLAIQCLLLIKSVFHLDFRKLHGFAHSLVPLLNLAIEIPSYTQICRRQKDCPVKRPRCSAHKALHVVVDSTGLKVYGEGEWKIRQHGYSKRRTWRKLHLGVDEATGDIVAMALTTNAVSDDAVFPDLLDQVEENITCVSADGAYDRKRCYEALDALSVQANIPPRKDAILHQHGNCKGPPLTRDENVRAIRKKGRKRWKRDCGYHRRSLAETAMFRFKSLFGCSLSARIFDHQQTEAKIKCLAMNKMTQLGMPDSQLVT